MLKHVMKYVSFPWCAFTLIMEKQLYFSAMLQKHKFELGNENAKKNSRLVLKAVQQKAVH